MRACLGKDCKASETFKNIENNTKYNEQGVVMWGRLGKDCRASETVANLGNCKKYDAGTLGKNMESIGKL